MFTLLKKEIRTFLSSLIGYIVICVFLLLLGLFMWVLQMDSNVLENGYASIDPLFAIGPWVFLFLIPAITMRSFSDEKRSGTIELLLTRPLTDLQIILAKYFAGITLVIFSLVPTFIYYYSVQHLSLPPGIDAGGTWGSYVGLLFLASAFVAIGIFSSSVTENQVVAFIIAVFLSFMFYMGFDYMSKLPLLSNIDNVILWLGINDHYISMSRGVLDTRDMIYFVSVIALFITLTKTVLESRKW
jgi:ABC-2 type transport system permease protein